MADTKVSALTADASPDAADLLMTVDDPSGTPTSKKATIDNVLAVNDARTKTLTNTTIDANGTGNSISNLEAADMAATGTPSSSTFLRGDNTWAAPAGGGGGDLLAANNLSDVGDAATSYGNIKQAASATATGAVELATIAEVDTGTDTARAITPAGLAGSALQTKVDGIETAADVTDTTNVTAAGALMDSELTDLAGVKALDTSTIQSQPSEGAFADGDKTKLDAIEASADVTDATNVAAAGALMEDGSGDLTGDLVMSEKADHSSTPGAGKGYLWVKNDTPSSLIYTDDAGTDVDLTAGGAGDLVSTNNLSDVSNAATSLSNLGGIGAATSDTLTNKTIDANGTGNSISNIDVADLANGTDGELITWDAAGAPATVSAGTATHVLTSNGAGAAPTFQAAGGGGGQTTYDVIIAASGGDYTTLDAYFLDAPTAGDRIWVNDSFTWGTTNVNSSLTNMTIEGPGSEAVRIDLATNNKRFGLSGAGCTVKGIGFDGGTGTSAYFNMTGDDARCEDVAYESAQPSIKNLSFTGARAEVTDCKFISTYTGVVTNSAYVNFTSDHGRFTNNYVEGKVVDNVVGKALFIFSSAENAIIANNTFVANDAIADGDYICGSGGGANIVFANNTIVNNDLTFDVSPLYNQGDECSMTGNIMSGLFLYGIRNLGSDNVYSNNVIMSDNASASIGVWIDSGDDNVITGNRIGGHGVGIQIDSGSNRTNASANALNSNSTAVTDNGTSTEVAGANT